MCVNSILITGIRAKEIQHDQKRWIVRSLESRSLMDSISISGRCRSKIICARKIFTNRGIHDGGEMETQGSPGSRVDPVDFVKKRCVQHREGEDYVRSVEGTVKHV